MSSFKNNVEDSSPEFDEELLREAISWKYELYLDEDITRKRRRLRFTDIQDLIWEFEDATLY